MTKSQLIYFPKGHKMKRVFQLAHTLNMAGTETVFMNWYRNIDRSVLQFDFCVNREYTTPLVNEIKLKGGQILIVSHKSGIWGQLKFQYNLYKTLKQHGPYLAFQTHSHWSSGIDCFTAAVAGIKKRYTISHYAQGAQSYSFRIKLLLPLYRLFIYLFSTKRLAVSEEAGNFLYGKYMFFEIIHNGINLQQFAYNPAVRKKKRAELGLENKFVVGNIARFTTPKNHSFLIDIFAEIRKQNPQAHLVLLGTGELEHLIKQKVSQLGLTHAVSFMGVCTNVQDFYQVFDVFLLPSLYEGLPCVAVEAQGSGLPCFLADTIAKETAICNTTFLSLSQSANEWGNVILEMTKNFVRKDESEVIRQAGFDVTEVGKFIQAEYLK